MMVHPKMQWYLTFPYKLHITLKMQWISTFPYIKVHINPKTLLLYMVTHNLSLKAWQPQTVACQ